MALKEAVITLAVLILASAMPIHAAEDPPIDVLNHDIMVEIYPPERFMTFGVYIDFVSLQNGLSTVELSLNSDMTIVGIYDINGQRGFTRTDDILTVQLDSPMAYGEVKRLRFDYTYRSTGDEHDFIWGYVGDEVSYLIYEYMWYPMVWGDRATATISVTVPEGLTAISIGKLTETMRGDRTTTYVWKTDSASRGISIVSGDYMIQSAIVYLGEEIPDAYGTVIEMDSMALPREGKQNDFLMVKTYLFPEDNHKVDQVFWYTTRILKSLSSSFNGYPYDEFRVVEMPDSFFGGHGDQEFIMVKSSAIHLDSDEFIAHEISHSWWGSLVFAEGEHTIKSQRGLEVFNPLDSDDGSFLEIVTGNNLWLHEGFATYSGVLYVEDEYGRDAMLESLEDKREEYLMTILKYGDKPITEMEEEYTDNQYHAIVYSKGAYVLHMLRYVVGDDIFFDILRAYINEFSERSASVEEFKGVAEGVYGRDLDWFFDQWLHGTGMPDYSVEEVETTETPGGYFVNVVVSQQGDEVNMPVEIAVKTSKGTQTEKTWILGDGKVVKFFTKERPISVEIDTDQWILESERSNNFFFVNTPVGKQWLSKATGSFILPNMLEVYLVVVLALMAYLIYKRWSESENPPIEY